MKRILIFALFAFCYFSLRSEEIPPYETPDPAISENFRNLYYAADKLSIVSVSSNVFCVDNRTLCVDFVAHEVYIGTKTTQGYPLQIKANSASDALSLVAKDGSANSTITFLDSTGTTNTRIEGGSNGFYGHYWEVVNLNSPGNNSNSKYLICSTTTGCFILGVDYPTGLQPYSLPSTVSLNVLSNTSSHAIRTLGYSSTKSNSDWTFADFSGTDLAYIEGGNSSSDGHYVVLRLANGPTINAIYVSSATGSKILASPGGDNGAIGYWGEYYSSSTISQGYVSPGNNQWFDIASTATTSGGDWWVSGIGNMRLNGATSTRFVVGISTSPGNDSSFLTTGSTAFEGLPADAAYNQHSSIPPLRFNTTQAKTFYLKAQMAFSAGSPQAFGLLQVHRRR